MSGSTAFLLRETTSDQGTEGKLFYDTFSCFTLELPWRDNQSNISCIPSGEYDVTIRKSPKFGVTYWVLEVPDRSYVLIHSANVAGDVSRGFKSHLNGCIALGRKRGTIYGQRAVLISRLAVKDFMAKMRGENFKLIIGGLQCLV